MKPGELERRIALLRMAMEIMTPEQRLVILDDLLGEWCKTCGEDCGATCSRDE